MSSDRARITYDEKQQYRSVVMQQGRVSLEADWNEQGQITNEEARKQALDFVGPSGVPSDDSGYAVTKGGTGGAYDLTLSSGTIYVGGLRVRLDQTLNYSKQPDWLDGDPDWMDVPTAQPATKEYVYLLLREQEITAVEDSLLREVALGGPDTAARTRLIQRVARFATNQQDCPSALADLAERHWQPEGLAFDGETMRLTSGSTLALDFDGSASVSDPCQPQATGGCLGPENQLIRVKITAADNAKKEYKLVWGFDNASYLYRIKEFNNNQKLVLNTQPVDSYHQPRAKQAVEILRSSAQLPNGEFVAASHGFVTALSTHYDRDRQAVELQDPLPDGYPQDQKSYLKSNPVFLRVWEGELTFDLGKPLSLGGTGLNVTLQADVNGFLHVGDFWLFAVRPGMPVGIPQVYPQRYAGKVPQLPDGPRLWACPLALVDWQATPGVLDCRNPFDNLVELTRRKLGGCCTVTVKPEDLTERITLQSIIDRYTSKNPITICLMPGVYSLHKPLVLGPEHSNLTLSGCHDGAVLQAEESSEDAFLDGLVVLNRANYVSFRNIRFQLPQASIGNIGGVFSALETKAIRGPLNQVGQKLKISIGIRAVHCALLNIEGCLFRFSLTKGENVWGAGIFANSECWGLTVKSSRFLHEEDYLEPQGLGPWRILSGFVLAPAYKQQRQALTDAVQRPTNSIVLPLLQDACFEDNQFSGLTFATFIYSDAGILEFRKNTVRDCMAGFFYASLITLAYTGDFSVVSSLLKRDTASVLSGPLQALGQNPYFVLGSAIARSLPLPKVFNADHAVNLSATEPTAKDEHHFTLLEQSLNHMLDSILVEGAAVADKPVPSATAASDAAAGTAVPVETKTQAIIEPAVVNSVTKVHYSLLGQERLVVALLRQNLRRLDLSLHFVDNDIDTQLGKLTVPQAGTLEFNFSFMALDTFVSSDSSLIMSGNRLRNHSWQLPTATAWAIQRCAITGNLIQNQAQNNPKLEEALGTSPKSLFATPQVTKRTKIGLAVTGNVLHGNPVWPVSRGLNLNAGTDPLLNSWDFLNTVI